MRTATDINDQFGVGEDFILEPEDAFLPSSPLMPQFSDIQDAEAASDVLSAAMYQDTLRPSSIRDDEEDLNSPLPITNRWHPQLIMDLALNLDDPEEIRIRHNLTEQDLDKLYTVPSFRREVAVLMRELGESGVTFKRKSALQAESYLQVIDGIMMNPDTAAATRLDIFKTTAKFGELEPKEDKSDQNNGPQVNVQINF